MAIYCFRFYFLVVTVIICGGMVLEDAISRVGHLEGMFFPTFKVKNQRKNLPTGLLGLCFLSPQDSRRPQV